MRAVVVICCVQKTIVRARVQIGNRNLSCLTLSGKGKKGLVLEGAGSVGARVRSLPNADHVFFTSANIVGVHSDI